MRIAKAQFHSRFGRIDEGEALPDDHPVVREFPGNFISPDEWAEVKAKQKPSFGPGPQVEQATAAPGEKRQTRRPAK